MIKLFGTELTEWKKYAYYHYYMEGTDHNDLDLLLNSLDKWILICNFARNFDEKNHIHQINKSLLHLKEMNIDQAKQLVDDYLIRLEKLSLFI